ncbi:MAG: serine hydrolase domain-containing protein [Bacteroidales bacterium]
MRTRTFIFSIIFLLGVHHLDAGSSTISELSSKGKLTGRIDSLVALHLEAHQPGGVIGILSGKEILLTRSYGLMDAEKSISNDEKTIFNIASVSKQFTAYAILSLERDGKLNLDDNIRKWLPDLPAYEKDITIRHLMQHTSGIASTDVLRLFAGISLDESWNQEEEYNLIKKYPQLNFTPNEKHVYSNAGYSLLARLVEQASGMDYAKFLDINFFRPLEMNSTFVLDGPGKSMKDVANGYRNENDSFALVSSVEDFSYGAGNIYSSIGDMTKWGANLLSAKAENRELLHRLGTPYNTLSNGDTIMYTYGYYVRNHKSVRMVEHSGGVPGFRNQFMIFPDHGFLIILMFNNESISTRQLATDIAELLLEGKLKEEVTQPRVARDIDRENVRNFEGNFQMPDGMELSFIFEQDTFWLTLPGDAKFQLFAENENKFFLKAFDAQCSFITSDNGEVNEMVWHQGGGDYPGFRVEERTELTSDELAGYAGSYIHEILNSRYPVAFADGKLTMQTPSTFKQFLGFDTVELTHISGDRFSTDRLGMLEFSRCDNGQVNGFVLADVGRLQNIRFSRQ